MSDDNPRFTTQLELVEAAQALARLDGYVWLDIGPKLTCSEAEVFATFLEVWGGCSREEFLAAHAEGDDEGDSHFDLKR